MTAYQLCAVCSIVCLPTTVCVESPAGGKVVSRWVEKERLASVTSNDRAEQAMAH